MTVSTRLVPGSAVATLVLGVAVASAAIAPTVTLRAGHGERSAVICGVRHHLTLYHRGEAVPFAGTIAAAGSPKLRVKIKQCVRGRFITRFETHVRAHNGQFSGSFRERGRGFYAVRAYFNGQKSKKRYLQIT
jgi:hypothetical protein